jgi:hypothetical protein
VLQQAQTQTTNTKNDRKTIFWFLGEKSGEKGGNIHGKTVHELITSDKKESKWLIEGSKSYLI